MAYPDAFQPIDSDPKTEDIPLVNERSKGLEPKTKYDDTIVHFDIDPLNGE